MPRWGQTAHDGTTTTYGDQMPAKSLKQLKLMYAVLSGKSKKVPRAVAEEYVEQTPKRKFARKTRRA